MANIMPAYCQIINIHIKQHMPIGINNIIIELNVNHLKIGYIEQK